MKLGPRLRMMRKSEMLNESQKQKSVRVQKIEIIEEVKTELREVAKTNIKKRSRS